MTRKNQGGAGVSSKTRHTRSSPRFALLEGTDNEFPELISSVNRTGSGPAAVSATSEPLVEEERGKQPTPTRTDAAGINRKAGTKQYTCDGPENQPAAISIAGIQCQQPEQLVVASTAAITAENGGSTAKAVNGAPLAVTPIAKVGAGIPKSPGQISQQTASVIQKPWTSLFKDNRAPSNGLKLRYIPPKGNSLDFSDRILPTMVEMWGFCLVGYITGKFPGLKAIYDLKNSWGVSCLVKSHAKGWIIFKFQNDEDRTKVLNGGPYTIFGMQLLLKSLSEDFSFDDDEFLKVPIWVKFPNLHMKLWNEEALSEVASMVGVPLATDKITQDRSNHLYARVLIEVDVSRPPPLSFPIRLPSHKVVTQSVVYETFPNFCFHCKVYGHHPFICKKLATKERDMIEAEKGGKIGIEGIQKVTKEKEKENAKVGIIEEEEGNEKSVPPEADLAAATLSPHATPVTSPVMEVVETVPKNTPIDTEDEESDTEGPFMSDDEELLLEEYWAKIKELRRLKKERKEKTTAEDTMGLG
ncbi:unnamed protein product [Cuscuta europaea]|uniref:DUF4283 domain-containing protein n=1 Tax=Cuscuta europaea TaxID=41803 RepID=A0A9P0Z1K5_CUSEU|nr:unnamed protein product [Cuscuta europaea]